MAAAAWMQHASEKGEEADKAEALTAAKQMFSRCREVAQKMWKGDNFPGVASNDKCLHFCLLLVSHTLTLHCKFRKEHQVTSLPEFPAGRSAYTTAILAVKAGNSIL